MNPDKLYPSDPTKCLPSTYSFRTVTQSITRWFRITRKRYRARNIATSYQGLPSIEPPENMYQNSPLVLPIMKNCLKEAVFYSIYETSNKPINLHNHETPQSTSALSIQRGTIQQPNHHSTSPPRYRDLNSNASNHSNPLKAMPSPPHHQYP